MVDILFAFSSAPRSSVCTELRGSLQREREMRNSVKNGAVVIGVSFAVVVLVIALVALIRCPAVDIPAVIQAFGSWLRISISISV
jgi:hypothetical protein